MDLKFIGFNLLKYLFSAIPYKQKYIYRNYITQFLLVKEKNIEGIKLKYRPHTNDKYVIQEVFGLDEYSLDELNLDKKSVIVDIGAHIGCFALKAAQTACEGKIFAFEPMKLNFRLLKKNVNNNNLKNVYLFRQGIAKEKAKRMLSIAPRNTGGHSITHKRSKKYEIIDCISLQDFIRDQKLRKIDVLKIDCEGGEYEIMYNMPKKCLNKIKRILMEFHESKNPRNQISELKKFLYKKGFNLQKLKRYTPIRGMAYFSLRN